MNGLRWVWVAWVLNLIGLLVVFGLFDVLIYLGPLVKQNTLLNLVWLVLVAALFDLVGLTTLDKLVILIGMLILALNLAAVKGRSIILTLGLSIILSLGISLGIALLILAVELRVLGRRNDKGGAVWVQLT